MTERTKYYVSVAEQTTCQDSRMNIVFFVIFWLPTFIKNELKSMSPSVVQEMKFMTAWCVYVRH